MYKVTKRLEIAGAHFLRLNYMSKCENLHGHNWVIWITCEAEELNTNGMVVDFAAIKSSIHGVLDHQNLNTALPGINPTAENIALWIAQKITLEFGVNCTKVVVQESENNTATWER